MGLFLGAVLIFMFMMVFFIGLRVLLAILFGVKETAIEVVEYDVQHRKR